MNQRKIKDGSCLEQQTVCRYIRKKCIGKNIRNNQNLILLTPGVFATRALEGLQVVGEEKDILKEIRHRMEMEDQEEVVVKAVKELKKSPTKSVKFYKWSLENGLLYY